MSSDTLHAERGEAERSGLRPLLAVCPAAFAAFLAAGALAPFLPVIAADLGVGVAQVGQVPALASAAAAGLGLVLGPLADRYGQRRALVAGVVAAAMSAIGAGVAPTFAALAVAALFVAIGRAAVPPAALALVGTRLPERERGRAISYVVAAFSGVPIVGLPALTTLAVVAGGWRIAFVALGVFALAVAALVLALVPADPPAGAAAGTSLRAAYAPLLRDRPTLGLIGSALLRNTCLWMLATYWGAFLVHQHGFSLAQVGYGYTATGVGHVAGSLLLGRAIRPGMPLRLLLALMTLVAGAAFAAALLSPFGAPVALVLASGGLLMIGATDVANAALLTTESPGGRVTTMTLNQAGLNLGTAAGGAVGGLLLAIGGYGGLGAAIPAVAVIAAGLVWLARPPRHQTVAPDG